MSKLHALLQRQIQKHFPETLLKQLPDGTAKLLVSFFRAVDQAYKDFDADRVLLERSTELSSQELFEISQEMRARNRLLEAEINIEGLLRGDHDIAGVAAGLVGQIVKATEFPFVKIEFWDREKEVLNVIAQHGTSEDLGNTVAYEVVLRAEDEYFGRISCAWYEKDGSPEVFKTWLSIVGQKISDAIERRAMTALMRQQQANIISSSKMSELGKMAGGIAHEINNPLTAINLLANTIKISCDSQNVNLKQVSKMADDIETIVKRIAKIILCLRTFSRDGSKDPLSLVRVKDLVDETLGLCQERLTKNYVNLTVNVPEGLEVYCREVQMCQVLLNLINNAYDAASELADKWIKIEARDLDINHIEISVTDSGAGIPQEVQEKLFTPFFTTKQVGEGTGLGLSISNGIVKDHNGEIRVDRECSNTRFVIRLPKL